MLAVRKATEGRQDVYGEHSRGAKRAEAVPALAGLGVAGYAASRRIRRIGRFFESKSARREFAIADSALGLLQRIGAKLAGQSRRRLIGGAATLGGTLGGLEAATDEDPGTGARGQTLAGGVRGAAIGTAGLIAAPYAYRGAQGIAARMRGLRPGMLRRLF